MATFDVLDAVGQDHHSRRDGARRGGRSVGRIGAEGKQIIARTAGLTHAVRRPIRSLIGYYLSGENSLRTYCGSGKVLLTRAPYLNQRLLSALES